MKIGGINNLKNWMIAVFLASMVVSWVILFSRWLGSSLDPFIYAIIAITVVISLFVFEKRPELLRNKKVIFILAIFIIIGVINIIIEFIKA